MIGAKLANGQYWDWKRSDALTLNGQELALSSIVALELEEMRLGGRDIDLGGATWRDLIATDPETGIHVVTSLPLPQMRELGLRLAGAASLVLATEMPRPPR
jgi:hypothetical protein